MQDYWSEGVQRRRDKLVRDLVATFTRPTLGTSLTLKGSCNLSLLKSFWTIFSQDSQEDRRLESSVGSDIWFGEEPRFQRLHRRQVPRGDWKERRVHRRAQTPREWQVVLDCVPMIALQCLNFIAEFIVLVQCFVSPLWLKVKGLRNV